MATDNLQVAVAQNALVNAQNTVTNDNTAVAQAQTNVTIAGQTVINDAANRYKRPTSLNKCTNSPYHGRGGQSSNRGTF